MAIPPIPPERKKLGEALNIFKNWLHEEYNFSSDLVYPSIEAHIPTSIIMQIPGEMTRDIQLRTDVYDGPSIRVWSGDTQLGKADPDMFFPADRTAAQIADAMKAWFEGWLKK